MAQRVVLTMSGNIAQVDHFTMNTYSIGENQANRHKPDVQLIQFFLWKFYNANMQLFSSLPTVSRTPEIIIDGRCGPQTITGILNFQKQHQIRGCPIWVDGVVHSTKHLLTPRNAAMYTIWWLNQWFVVNGEEPDEQKADLTLHPIVRARAPELCNELHRVQNVRTII